MTPAHHPDIPFTSPMECLPVNDLPDGPGWVYELKLDGYRAKAIRDERGVHLLSRNGKDFSRRFQGVFAALKDALPLGTAVDGELVASMKPVNRASTRCRMLPLRPASCTLYLISSGTAGRIRNRCR